MNAIVEENYSEFAYLLDLTKQEIKQSKYVNGISFEQYVEENNIPLLPDAIKTLSARTANFYQTTKLKNVKRRNDQNVYYCEDAAYILATLYLVSKGL